jgi:hypothetical protein
VAILAIPRSSNFARKRVKLRKSPMPGPANSFRRTLFPTLPIVLPMLLLFAAPLFGGDVDVCKYLVVGDFTTDPYGIAKELGCRFSRRPYGYCDHRAAPARLRRSQRNLSSQPDNVVPSSRLPTPLVHRVQIFPSSPVSQPNLLKSRLVGLHIKWRDVSAFGYIYHGALRTPVCAPNGV